MSKVFIEVDLSDDGSIEQALGILDTLVGVTKGGSAPAAKAETKPAATKAETAPKTETAKPTKTVDEVRQVLKELAALSGKDAAVKILNDNGAASISELAEDKYAAVHAEAQAQIDAGAAAEAEVDELG